MKSLSVFILSIFISATCFTAKAQDDDMETLFGKKGDIKISGFGGPMMEFSTIKGDFAFFMGGGGAVLINDRYFLGGYGLGYTNNTTQIVNNEAAYLHFGHGGFWFGYQSNPNKLIHLTGSIKTGWGSVSWLKDNFSHNNRIASDQVFVITPEIGAELNVFRFMRMGLTGSYRIVTGAQMDNISNTDLSSPSVSMTFKFGWF